MIRKNKLFTLAKSITYYNTLNSKKITLFDFQIKLIIDSGLFDIDYYNKKYNFKYKSYTRAIFHYLKIGTKKNYNPNEFFNTEYYFETYPDIRKNNENPLVHFIAFGSREGRNPSKEFNTNFYYQSYPDVVNQGMMPLYHYLYFGHKEFRKTVPNNQFHHWYSMYDILSIDRINEIKNNISKLNYTPLISVIMPVYNPNIEFFHKAIESVTSQLYGNWELCIADDASTDEKIKTILKKYAKEDERIKVIFRKNNGHISEASNSAIEISQGDYIALLDQDDELSIHSLYMIVNELNKNRNLKLIYSDEDKIDEHGNRFNPHFKPEWSPDLLYCQNYISHLGVYDSEIVKKIKGFRKGFEGSQDYDLLLRFIEHIDKSQIKRIPSILYHWRAIKGSTAFSINEKSYAVNRGIKALQEHLDRTNQNGKAEVSAFNKQFYYVKRGLPSTQPLVSLIIPTKDKIDILDKCLQSILNKTTYTNYEIIIVDNNSEEIQSKIYFTKISEKYKKIKVIKYEKPFNYSAINNFAVKQANGSIIGLINNDIVVITNTWLDEMVSHIIRKDVGAVGAKLYYENNTIQHAGVIVGIGGVAGHIQKYHPRNSEGYFGRLFLTQNFSAVTAACLILRKDVFNEVNGLNEKDLTVAFNDVDLCLKIRQKGYLIVWTPYAELYHLESISRGNDSDPDKIVRFQKEISYMHTTWKTNIISDPYYNPNFTLETEDYILSFPPRPI